MEVLKMLWGWVNAQAGWVLLAGLAAVALWNRWKWRTDRVLAMQLRERRPEPVKLKAMPRVSVLVAAWNEAHVIQEHIESFLRLRYPNKELILCAGGEDGTYEIACHCGGEQVMVLEQQQGEGKQRALRRCLERATGEVVFLTDADCLLDDRSLELTLVPLVNDGEGAATGRFAPLRRQRGSLFVMMQWYVDNYARARSPQYVEGLIGRNAAVSRFVLGRSGGFSTPVSTGTDYYLARQLIAAGARIRYVHDSIVETEYVTTPGAYLRQQSRWLRNILLHGQECQAGHQVRSALFQCLSGVVVILWPLTCPFTGWLGLVIWFVVLLYGAGSRFRYVRFGEITLRQSQRWSLYLLAPLYLLLDQVMLSYALVEWLLPRLRWKW